LPFIYGLPARSTHIFESVSFTRKKMRLMMNVIISLSFFIAPWFLTIAVSPQSLLIIKTTRDDFYLLESNTNAYTRIIKRIFALNSHYSTSSNTGKLAFLLGQSGCPRKIDFNNIARLNRRYHRNRYKNAYLANIRASAVKESFSLWQPNTNRPR
jgi:hypothetical protein